MKLELILPDSSAEDNIDNQNSNNSANDVEAIPMNIVQIILNLVVTVTDHDIHSLKSLSCDS